MCLGHLSWPVRPRDPLSDKPVVFPVRSSQGAGEMWRGLVSVLPASGVQCGEDRGGGLRPRECASFLASSPAPTPGLGGQGHLELWNTHFSPMAVMSYLID